MKVIQTIKQLKEAIALLKQGNKTIGLVPTMGYLHEGHLTLAQVAKSENDVVVMSIFVNPTQFGPNEDFDAYPRDLNRDTVLAESVGVDIIFAPNVEDMYPNESTIQLQAGKQATILCGASRPGHFDGVLQVVTKLFHLVQPNIAYFGQKDAQQVAIIETLVRDFNFPLEIHSVPIVREEDGLAKSSRNIYLTEKERAQAPALYRALNLAKQHYINTNDVQQAIQVATSHITSETNGKIDYIEFLSYPDLAAINKETTKFIVATAIYIGNTRLIDNVIFEHKGDQDHV